MSDPKAITMAGLLYDLLDSLSEDVRPADISLFIDDLRKEIEAEAATPESVIPSDPDEAYRLGFEDGKAHTAFWAESPQSEGPWVRLHDTVRLMRSVVSHHHEPPWPCPVHEVDLALAATSRLVGYDRPYPDDLAAIHKARLGTRLTSKDVEPASPSPEPTAPRPIRLQNDDASKCPVCGHSSSAIIVTVDGVESVRPHEHCDHPDCNRIWRESQPAPAPSEEPRPARRNAK